MVKELAMKLENERWNSNIETALGLARYVQVGWPRCLDCSADWTEDQECPECGLTVAQADEPVIASCGCDLCGCVGQAEILQVVGWEPVYDEAGYIETEKTGEMLVWNACEACRQYVDARP